MMTFKFISMTSTLFQNAPGPPLWELFLSQRNAQSDAVPFHMYEPKVLTLEPVYRVCLTLEPVFYDILTLKPVLNDILTLESVYRVCLTLEPVFHDILTLEPVFRS